MVNLVNNCLVLIKGLKIHDGPQFCQNEIVHDTWDFLYSL